MEAFYLANPHMKKLMVVDARPRMNAMANTAVGAGFEQSKFYPFCELKFLGQSSTRTHARARTHTPSSLSLTGSLFSVSLFSLLGIGNIHVMRDSWKKLRTAVASPDDPKWFSNLEASGNNSVDV